MIVKAISRLEMESLYLNHKYDLLLNNNIISIIDPDAEPIFYPYEALTLSFWDLESPIHAYYHPRLGLTNLTQIFDKEMARQVVNYVLDYDKNGRDWLIHCTAGISRSGAVSLFIAEFLNLDMNTFFAQNPDIYPNNRVLTMLREEANDS